MDAIESAKTKVIICMEHRKKGRECACCPLEDHCHTTRRQLFNGEILLRVDEEHFRIIEEWKENNKGLIEENALKPCPFGEN